MTYTTTKQAQAQGQGQGQSTLSKRGKFCKVCFSAGKSEVEYTSHFVKSSLDTGGVVVCPSINNAECRYCHKIGHTVKYCKVLEEKEKQTKKHINKRSNTTSTTSQSEKEKESKQSKQKIKKTNPFEILMDHDEDEYEDEDEITNHTQNDKGLSGWAAILAAPAPAPAPAPTPAQIEKQLVETIDPVTVSVSNSEQVFKKPIDKTINWADYDSDSDME